MLLLFTHKNRTGTSTEALNIVIKQASCHDDKPILAAKLQNKSEINTPYLRNYTLFNKIIWQNEKVISN